ncbi:MAG: alpha-ketoacid dehydrogenase subunit beta [Nitrospirae bacterium CG_4_10_14_3_um_filter_44_29]|nr:MAG: alpha-ketoacid dehydrogenase subunit beta [Nitrospirae bacterium CG_4_10_14_3_um_filter_44_29]
MFLKSRKLQYSLAINEALDQMMSADKFLILLGQGVRSPWYVGNTTQGLFKKFGSRRVIDTPVSENAITGVAVGAAIAGIRSIVVHPRMDFMLYAADPIINQAANWHYMFGGASSVPMVIWAIINRGREQAAQHSQALQAIFTHIPGLKVVAPSNPYDAKGLFISAIKEDNPVLYLDNRWLYEIEGDVPEEIYAVPIGKGKTIRKGKDVTIAASSYMVWEAKKAVNELVKEGINPELIDLRSLKPLDSELLFLSVKKTGRLVVVDEGWQTCGVAAEISALVGENIFASLQAPIRRITLPDSPAPASSALEGVYYPKAKDICEAVRKILKI